MVGIIGAASRISPRYRDWMAGHPQEAARHAAAAAGLASFVSPMTRATLDHGEFGTWLDDSMRAGHLAAFARLPDDSHGPATGPAPSAEEWAAHVTHVIDVAGPSHVGIGLDLAAAHHPNVIGNASGYPDLITALRRITSEENVRMIAGENWLRVLGAVT